MPNNTYVRRVFPAVKVRVHDGDEGEGSPRRIVGHAAVFNVRADLGFYQEEIEPGAFATLHTDDVRSLKNHDPNLLLGRQSAGTLVLRVDEIGLWTETTPPDTQYARDLMVSIDRGDLTQMSFGFFIRSDRWEKKDGLDVRFIEDVELFDISPVTFPAYTDTDVSLREAANGEQAAESLMVWKSEHPDYDPPAPEPIREDANRQMRARRGRVDARP